MKTISLKVHDTLDSRLTEEARRRRTSRSAVEFGEADEARVADSST